MYVINIERHQKMLILKNAEKDLWGDDYYISNECYSFSALLSYRTIKGQC